MDEHSADFNTRMRQAREAAGLTQLDVMVAMRAELPRPMWFSQSKFHRLETSTKEAKAEPMAVAWLASLYGVKTSDLSVTAHRALEAVRDLVSRNAWLGTHN